MSGVELPSEPLTQPLLASALSRLRTRAGGPTGDKEAEKAAKDFESVLLLKLLEEMERSIPKSGLLESSTTKQVQGLFWFYLAQDVGRSGGLGLWKQMAEELRPAAPAAGETGAGSVEPSP